MDKTVYKTYKNPTDNPWNNLSMADKAAMMEVAIRNGITTLPEIKEAYNEFAKGGNLYELGGPKRNSYDKPQTFMGRVAQVLGASPHNSRGMDVVSSIAQTLPKASPAVSALDLGYDLNRAYHGEEGALADAGLDILGMLPYISKGGIKAGRGILDVVRGNEKLRKAWNISAGTAKALDFNSDTLGANRTSDATNKKKSLGGSLYPDGGYVRSTNNHPVAFDSEGNLVDQVTGETGTMMFPEILLTADPDDVARGRAQRWYKDFGTESNDATSVADGRRQNSHLDERSAEGAAKAAGWAKDHPVLNTVGLGLGAAPFAVAAYPGAVVGGELLGTALANPYVDAGLTSVFAAHGLNHAINEGITDWKDGVMTALEVTPLGRLAKPLWNAGKEITLAAENYRYPLGRPMGEAVPQITAENAASMTSEQWTAAQDAAIARGDMAEAQRLRDLHFKVSAPDTKVVDGAGNPQLVIHKTPNDFTVFDNSRSIGNLNWAATPKAFEGENGVFATGAGTNPKEMRLYINMKNPHYPTIDEGMEPAFIEEGEDGILGIVDKDMTGFYKSASDAGEGFHMSLGVDNPYALKSENVVTYDNNGVRIPLGMRDNFKINDIRYGLLPFLGLGTASTLYMSSGNENAYGGNLFGDGSYMEQAKALIRNNEGWRATPYKDAPKGVSWRSVGYGFNDSGFREKYPEGISKHYEHGITRAQAEQELDYYLNKAEKQLRGIYGKRWNSFTDGQKAAILDTYYQRPASVANKSAFYNAVMSGKDPSKYLGVVGFDKRNNIRRNTFLSGFSGSYDIPQDAYAIQQYNNTPTTLFAPSNPEVFFGGYKAPEIEAPLPSIELDDAPQYSEEEIARQERRERLNNLSMLMSLTSPQGSSNSMLDALGLLMR